MSLWSKVKKGAKKLGKKAKKAAKKGEKTVVRAEKVADKVKNKVVKAYNKQEAPLRNSFASVIPGSLRKRFVRGAKMVSSTVNRVDRAAKKLAKKAGLSEAYRYGEHFNPLSDLKNAALMVQGKKSIGEILLEGEMQYSDGMLKDKLAFEKWQGKKLIQAPSLLKHAGRQGVHKLIKAPSLLHHSGKITNASGSHEQIKIPELNLHPGDGPHNAVPEPVMPEGRGGNAEMVGKPQIEGSLRR